MRKMPCGIGCDHLQEVHRTARIAWQGVPLVLDIGRMVGVPYYRPGVFWLLEVGILRVGRLHEAQEVHCLWLYGGRIPQVGGGLPCLLDPRKLGFRSTIVQLQLLLLAVRSGALTEVQVHRVQPQLDGPHPNGVEGRFLPNGGRDDYLIV